MLLGYIETMIVNQSRQWVSGSLVKWSTNVNGSRGSSVSALKHLTHDSVRCKHVRG